MKRRMVTLLVLFVLLAPGMAPALKTNQVEFGKDGAYDGHVTITRDVSGNMLFKDDSLTSPIALETIAHGVRNHGELTGLGNDDHTQYLNTGRHGAAHTAIFNNSLPIGPDVMGNTTIGQHVQDSDIHISRSLGEMIVGPWKFDVLQEFRGNIKLSQHGLPGKMDIYFEDGESDAHLRWNKLYDRFEFNRMLYTPEANFDSVTATTLRIGEDLYGNRPNYPPGGRISNFVSIEGIASENLLDKSADEDISGKWDFLNDVYIDGDLVTSGTITSLGGIKGLSKENVISVAKKGGDYETVQEAVNAAQAGTTILVYPGTYNEQVTINKSNIALIGVVPNGNEVFETHNTGVIITHASTGENGDLMTMWIKSGGSTALTGVVLANLTIINTSAEGTGDAQEALDIGRYDTLWSALHEVLVKNCSFYGSQDTVFVNISAFYPNCPIFDGCYFNGTLDVVSVGSSCILRRCFIEQTSASHNSCFWIGRTDNITKAYLIDCYFKTNNGNTFGCFGADNATVYLLNCLYPQASSSNISWNANGHSGTIYLYKTNGLYTGTGISLNVLKEDVGAFNSLKINGTERIDSSGNIKGATLYSGGNMVADSSGALISYTTLWKDFPACQGQNAHSADMEGHTHTTDNPEDHQHVYYAPIEGEPTYTESAGAHTHTALTSTNGNSWHPAAGNDVTYMHCAADNKCYLFSITYEAGTVLKRLRIEWQAEGINDGVKVRLVKRAPKASSWTTVGAQQTYTDASAPFDLTICSGSPEYYDFPDETMETGYCYGIEIESEVTTTACRWYSIGLETGPRIY